MKVLVKGNYEHVFPMEVKCRRVVDKYGFDNGKEADFCGSVLEVDAEDIVKHPWEKYPDYSGVDFGVICPVCKRFVQIKTDSIPKLIQDAAKKVSLDRGMVREVSDNA